MASLSGSSRALPDPVEWPQLSAARTRFAVVVCGVALLGLLSSLLIGWALRSWEVAALYGAMHSFDLLFAIGAAVLALAAFIAALGGRRGVQAGASG